MPLFAASTARQRRTLSVALAAVLVGGSATGAVVLGAGGPAGGESAAAAPATAANEADLAFLRAMIVHHAQAVEIAELVASRSDRDRLVDFAEGVIDAQAYEIEWMQDLLAAEGEPPVDLDAGHHEHPDMPGMLSPAQVEAMRQADGAAFDELFLRGMIEHHEGAVVMAEQVLDEGASLAVAHLAVDVLEQQEPEIAVLRRWLDDWT